MKASRIGSKRRIVLAGAIAGVALALPAPGEAADLVVYGDALASGWQDVSWGATVDFSHTGSPHSGAVCIAVTYTPWGALGLHAPSVDVSGHDTLQFWARSGVSGQALAVDVNSSGSPHTVVVSTVWQRFSIPLSEFASPTNVTDITWQDATGNASYAAFLDDIAFVEPDLIFQDGFEAP